MELMQLEMFVAVVEERSFLRAAERVFRTQPAVSIGLRKLEGRIGVPLLDRSHRRGGRLTPAGELFYEYASRILGLTMDATPVLRLTMTNVIYVLTTGGTMEKVYSEQTGSVSNVDSKIDRYLGLLRLPDCEVNVVPLMNKDSLEMTDADRVLVLGMIRAVLKENAPIVITHGTDTMVQTGLYLQRALPNLEMPIVLTGP